MTLDLERIPGSFYLNAEWLEHYGVLTGPETPTHVEVIDVNHIVPSFSVPRLYIAEVLFKTWRKPIELQLVDTHASV